MFDEKEIAYLQEMEERITRSMAVLIESDVTPKFNLLRTALRTFRKSSCRAPAWTIWRTR